MALFSTGDGFPSPETTFVMRLNNDVWAKRALITALFLLSQPYNWEQIGTATPQEAADCFSEAMATLRWGGLMIGAIIPYVSTNPPDLTIACDGGTYNRVDYPLLYAALDSAYIIDADTFTTPNLNGRAVIGADGTYTVNSTGGSATHTLDISEIPSHDHTYIPPTLNVDMETPGAPDLFAAGVGLPTVTGATGGGGAHNNMQPYIALNWAIVAA